MSADVEAALRSWLEDHTDLIGEGSALDNALRLLDHAYNPEGCDFPGYLSAHTPTLVREDRPIAGATVIQVRGPLPIGAVVRLEVVPTGDHASVVGVGVTGTPKLEVALHGIDIDYPAGVPE